MAEESTLPPNSLGLQKFPSEVFQDAQIWHFRFLSTNPAELSDRIMTWGELKTTGIDFQYALGLLGKTSVEVADCIFLMKGENTPYAQVAEGWMLGHDLNLVLYKNERIITVDVQKRVQEVVKVEQARMVAERGNL